jgi:ATP-binding cassette subfamily B protein
MDCGPAALAALLIGCGKDVSYPRLRESCQTDVDGTSIDRLEELACRFGLDAEQVILPNDAVLDGCEESVPCVAVVVLPSGLTHFVVVWNVLFGYVQIMDPAVGRRWVRKDAFLDSLYQHRMLVSKKEWIQYAESHHFRTTLTHRLRKICQDDRWIDRIMKTAYENGDWRSIASLDAVLRFAGAPPALRALRADRQRLLHAYADHPMLLSNYLLPDRFQVTAVDGKPDSLSVRGAVLIQVGGFSAPPNTATSDSVVAHARSTTRPSASSWWREVRATTGTSKNVLVALSASAIAASVTLVEGLLLRYMVDLNIPHDFVLLLGTLLILMLPLVASIAIDLGVLGISQGVGRRIDIHLRTSMLERLPKIRDEYFASRLTSDLAMRGHNVSELKAMPHLQAKLVSLVARMVFLAIGLCWLMPAFALHILAGFVLSIATQLLVMPYLRECDLRSRSHLAAIGKIHLDSLRGAELIWSHNASKAVAYEHEALQVAWWRTSFHRSLATTVLDFSASVILFTLAVYLVLQGMALANLAPGTVLLLAYWAFNLPLTAHGAFTLSREIAPLHNILGRVSEVLSEEEVYRTGARRDFNQPVSIEFRDVEVVRSQTPILRSVNVVIPPGQRVAIVGPSGSGKSTLIGALLGFNSIESGKLFIHGRLVTPDDLATLRESSVILNSELYLWNKSILENLLYGTANAGRLDAALRDSEFQRDLSRIARGLDARIGENGSRLSGGEGQRLRLARSAMRLDPVLVLMDEPFRGIGKEQRTRLLERLLKVWHNATLLYVSHNVTETQGFDRILVLDECKIVEDGSPHELLEIPGSLYSRLTRAEGELLDQIIANWPVINLKSGQNEAGVSE